MVKKRRACMLDLDVAFEVVNDMCFVTSRFCGLYEPAGRI
jgi:hypothetical protein